MHKSISLIPQKIIAFTTMILRGLCCLHATGYFHCDPKPDNILAFPSDQQEWRVSLKIADFGLAKEPDGKRVPELNRGIFQGTPIHMSPESVALGEVGPALDIWSPGRLPYIYFSSFSNLQILVNQMI